jgi:hypothetical protein
LESVFGQAKVCEQAMNRIIGFTFIAIQLGACSAEPPPAKSAAPPELQKLLNDARVSAPPYDTVPTVPLAVICPSSAADEVECQVNQLGMLKDWPQAWAGSYQAQRNVAFMLSNSSLGIQAEETQGCVWRIVLTLSGHSEYNGTLDQANYDLECGRLSEVNWAAAKQAATSTFKTITGKELPSIPEPARDR